ncbi:PilZ domain-containing protein [Oligoflexus tunisiensis]|uniref:PilZ domain-containing protein n=1 Tax=Oligoflexus tunisiensis TaxID=708132 RepID=UPI00114D0D88|nr:PilZ domain-containing protein [Oligoflexus tunisiensis]
MAHQNRQLLKKRAQRRELYLGENIRAFLILEGSRIVGGEVISLSETGLAFVCEPQVDSELPIGRVVQLKLYYDARRFFTSTVEIRNKSVFNSQGSQYLRVGVAAVPQESTDTKEQLEQKLSRAINLGAETCGFVEIENPMFFAEHDYFSIRAVHPDFVLVAPLENRHFLLPGQPVQARFQIPGSQSFVADLIVDRSVPDQDWWATDVLMLNFSQHSEKILARLAKMAMIQRPQLHVQQILDAGFPVPYLDFLLRVQFSPRDGADLQTNRLKRSFLAPYQYRADHELKSARVLSFYRQNTLIATMKLNFVPDVRYNSAFYEAGVYNHQFYRKPVVEILDFRHHPDYPLPSILVPIMQQCLRASIQADFSFLVFECTQQTEHIFHRMGFATLKTRSPAAADRSFVSLGIKYGLSNLTRGVHHDTWERVYKRLHAYLNRKHPLARNIA